MEEKNWQEAIEEKVVQLAPPPWVPQEKLNLEDYEAARFGEDGFYFDHPFLEEEMDRALGYCRARSSPGLDGVEYNMIKLASSRFKGENIKYF